MPNFVGSLPKGTRWYKNGRGDIDRTLVDAIKSAIATGYRHLDAAEEKELGAALKELGMSRDEFFITTKVLTNVKDPENALKTSLKKMGIEFVDLYLIHAPFDVEIEKAWAELEKLKDRGLAKNIGVSNFRIKDLQRILKVAKHKPVVNQIELHPYLQQNSLKQFHAENDIITEAYGPLTPLTTKPDGPLTAVVDKIAQREGKTPAQVLLKWSLQKDALPVTTSANKQRQKEQLEFNEPAWKLSDAQMNEIDETGKTAPFRKFWGHQKDAQWDP